MAKLKVGDLLSEAMARLRDQRMRVGPFSEKWRRLGRLMDGIGEIHGEYSEMYPSPVNKVRVPKKNPGLKVGAEPLNLLTAQPVGTGGSWSRAFDHGQLESLRQQVMRVLETGDPRISCDNFRFEVGGGVGNAARLTGQLRHEQDTIGLLELTLIRVENNVDAYLNLSYQLPKSGISLNNMGTAQALREEICKYNIRDLNIYSHSER